MHQSTKEGVELLSSTLIKLKHFVMRNAPHGFLRIFLGKVEKDHRRSVQKIREEVGLCKPGVNPAERRSSDTVFLLGSGASINDISSERWNLISKHDSMGLNFWVRHPFVPTFAFFEATAPIVFEKFSELAHQRESDYRETLKIITMHINFPADNERQFLQLPESWRKEAWVFDTATIFARNAGEVDQEIRRLIKLGLFKPTNRVCCLFKYMGTVTSMISLAIHMGYENIVLCGVDLVTPGYFYQDESQYPDMNGFLSSAPGARHASMSDGLPHCSADEVIYALRDLVARPAGINIYVENASSGLFPRIPEVPKEMYLDS